MAKSTEEIKGIIKELGDTQWSKDNETQGKAVQLLKGLAFSDEPIANKFMEALDKASSSIASKLLGENKSKGGKVIEEWTDNGKPESKKEKEIVAKLSKLDIGEVMKLQMKAFKDKDKDMMIATMNRMAELEGEVAEWEDDVIEETKALPVGLLHCDHFLGGDLMEEEVVIHWDKRAAKAEAELTAILKDMGSANYPDSPAQAFLFGAKFFGIDTETTGGDFMGSIKRDGVGEMLKKIKPDFEIPEKMNYALFIPCDKSARSVLSALWRHPKTGKLLKKFDMSISGDDRFLIGIPNS